jgi:hypothetical protein
VVYREFLQVLPAELLAKPLSQLTLKPLAYALPGDTCRIAAMREKSWSLRTLAP